MALFALKRVSFRGIYREIVLQNENGPCPILAIVNVLLLSGRSTLEEQSVSRRWVLIEDLVQAVAEVVLSSAASVSSSDPGRQMQIESTLEMLPSLSRGLDLNIFFNRVRGFEFTPALDVFDSLGITLVHGWLVDPQQTEVAQATANKSYNQIVFELAAAEQPTPPATPPAEGGEAASASATVATASATAASGATPSSPIPTASPSLRQQHARVIEEFLRDSASQLTYYGLAQLHQEIREEELAVLFRNNHFSVVTRRQGKLYLLVSDAGLAESENVVWEALDVCDSVFYDAHFVSSESSSSLGGLSGLAVSDSGAGSSVGPASPSSGSNSSNSSSSSRSGSVAVRDINFDSILRPLAPPTDDIAASERLARQLEREDLDRAMALRLQQSEGQVPVRPLQHRNQQHQQQQQQQLQYQEQYREYVQQNQNQNWSHLNYADWRAAQPPPKRTDGSGCTVM